MPRTSMGVYNRDFLEEKILIALNKHPECDGDCKGNAVVTNLKDYWGTELAELNAQIVKDLSKVEFDCENLCGLGEDWAGEEQYGFHTLDNGLTFLGLAAGGDWEWPVYFIIYWDGFKLRGYIPTKGNCYDVKNKIAWGNEDELGFETEEECDAYAKQYRDMEEEERFDFEELKKDIKKRIKMYPSAEDMIQRIKDNSQ